MRTEAERRVEFERPVEQLARGRPLAQREERFDRVGHEHRARRSFDAALPGSFRALLGDVDRFRVATEVVHRIGQVHPIPQARGIVALSERPGPLEIVESALDLAAGEQRDTTDVRRDRHARQRLHRFGLPERLLGDIDGFVQQPGEHESSGEFSEHVRAQHARGSAVENGEGLAQELDRSRSPDIAK